MNTGKLFRIVLFSIIPILMFLSNKNFAQDNGYKFYTQIFDPLTEDQRQAVWDKVRELSNKSALREDIHDEVVEMLEIYGVDVPDNFKLLPFPGPHPLVGWIYHELTEDQRTELHRKMIQLMDEGANPGEMRNTLREMLESYGIDMIDAPLWVDQKKDFERLYFKKDSTAGNKQIPETKPETDK